MNWPEKLRSSPVIAAAAILVALLIGVALGLAGPSPRPLPVSGEVTHEEGQKSGGVKAGQPRNDVRPTTPRDNSGNPRDGGSPRGQNTGAKPESGKEKPPHPRETGAMIGSVWSRPKALKEGPKNDLQAQVATPVPRGAILVSVKTNNDYSVQQAVLRLEILADGIGWQPVQNRATPGTDGSEYRFDGLFPGSYKVTCSTPGFSDASEEVRLLGGIQEVQVRLVIASPRWSRVNFAFEYEDGGKPADIVVQRAERGAYDNTVDGRFNRYGSSTIELGAVNSSSSRYMIPPETGLLVFAVRVGMRERFVFSNSRDGKRYRAEMEVEGKDNEEQRYDVALKLLEKDAPDPSGGLIQRDPVKLEVSFARSDGAPVKLRRCNVRLSVDAATYVAATRIDGANAEFAGIQPGTWFLVAEAEGLDAAFVRQVGVGESLKLSYMIDLGRITVRTTRDTGAAAPAGTRMTYSIGLRPMGSGALESHYSREIPQNAQTDMATFTVPAGTVTIAMGSNDKLLAVEPPSTQVTVALEGEISLAALLRVAATLEFMCIDAAFAPVPGVEFLVTFSPAGEIAESERPRIQLAGADGRGKQTGAPYGQVYLHLWITSKDLQRPDQSYVLDLPAYGVLNLGAITVR